MSSKNITYKNRNKKSLPIYYGTRVHFTCSHGLDISLRISQRLNSYNIHSFSLMFLFILEKFYNLFCIGDGSLRMGEDVQGNLCEYFTKENENKRIALDVTALSHNQKIVS